MAMFSFDTLVFTPNEAAVLTRLSLKAVNNAIDKKIVRATAGNRAGHATRLVGLHALMSLALERRLGDRLAPQLRRELFDALERTAHGRVSLVDGLLTVDLREPRRELAAALRALRRVRTLVTSDPDVMGGDPVFRGTRVPVHLVAALLEKGVLASELLEDYPRLTADMVGLAPLYAAAYPSRGRPRTQPWHDRPAIRTTRRKLASYKVQHCRN